MCFLLAKARFFEGLRTNSVPEFRVRGLRALSGVQARTRSRILYEQMLGRATLLCPEIGKETFRISAQCRACRVSQGCGLVSADRPPRNSPQIVDPPAGISQYLATAANAFGHAVERCVLAIDCIVRIIHQVFLRGHLISRRLAVADRRLREQLLDRVRRWKWCGWILRTEFRAGMLTIRIAYSLDGQEVPPTPA